MGMANFGPWCSETPEPIHLKSSMCDYVNSPTHMQNMVATKKWWWSGHTGEVAPSRALFIFFGSYNASTAYPEKRGFSLSATKNVFR